jgi:DNA-directed RNA polymerase subunit M/transcription elongation factor TFIIS
MNFPLIATLPANKRAAIVRKLERGCYNTNIEKSHKNHTPNYWDNSRFVEQYETICYNVKVNIDPESSVNARFKETSKAKNYLIKRVYASHVSDFVRENWVKTRYPMRLMHNIVRHMNVVKPEDVGQMNSIEMNPFISRKFLQDIAKRGEQTIDKKFTTMYACPKHGHRQATIRSQQTRSGDEGLTYFLNCLVCDDRWTI